MGTDNDKYKLIIAGAIGAIGGWLLSEYLRSKDENHKPLSKHLATLSEVLEQLEGIDTKEVKDLKDRIHNIITTIESSYGITKG